MIKDAWRDRRLPNSMCRYCYDVLFARQKYRERFTDRAIYYVEIFFVFFNLFIVLFLVNFYSLLKLPF